MTDLISNANHFNDTWDDLNAADFQVLRAKSEYNVILDVLKKHSPQGVDRFADLTWGMATWLNTYPLSSQKMVQWNDKYREQGLYLSSHFIKWDKLSMCFYDFLIRHKHTSQDPLIIVYKEFPDYLKRLGNSDYITLYQSFLNWDEIKDLKEYNID